MNVDTTVLNEEYNQFVDESGSPSTEVEQVEQTDQVPTQIEVVQNSTDTDSGETSTTSLDIGSLNDFFASEEELRASQIQVGQNDYFDFMPETIQEYFAGIMDKYPLTDYYAYHQRHWIQNTQYYSYYDDYYYLWPDTSSNDCIEVIKYNGQSNYVVNHISMVPATATIEYGSEVGQSDIRKGVSTIESKALLLAVGFVLCTWVLNNLWKHIVR